MSETEALQLQVYEDYMDNLTNIEEDLDNTTSEFSIEKYVNGHSVLTSKVVDKLDNAIQKLVLLRDKAIMLDGLDRATKAGDSYGRVNS